MCESPVPIFFPVAYWRCEVRRTKNVSTASSQYLTMTFCKVALTIYLAFFPVCFEYGQGLDYVMINILELDDQAYLPNCTDDEPDPEPGVFSFDLPDEPSSTVTDSNETLPTAPYDGGIYSNTTDWPPPLDQLITGPNTDQQITDPTTPSSATVPVTAPRPQTATSATDLPKDIPSNRKCFSGYGPIGPCSRVINITWLPTPPFMFQQKNTTVHAKNENADLKGVFYNIIGRAVQFCCKHFDQRERGTRFQYTHKAWNKSMLHTNIFHGDAAVGLPVYIENEFFSFHYAGSLEFIKVLESPGLILITDRMSAREHRKEMVWRAIANEWPIMLISLLLCAISGICVWALVSIFFSFR